MNKNKLNIPLIVALVILSAITFMFGLVMMDYFSINCTSFPCYIVAVFKAFIAAAVTYVSFMAVLYVKVAPSRDTSSAGSETLPNDEDGRRGGAIPITMYDGGIPEGGVRCPSCGEIYYSPSDKAVIQKAGKCHDCSHELV